MDLPRILLFLSQPFLRYNKTDEHGNKYTEKLEGGAIIAANHIGYGDAVAIASLFPYRRTFYLVAEVVMNKPVIGRLLKGAGCIKIDRNSTDIEAIRTCSEVLKNNKLLLMFPEGKIMRDDLKEGVKSGALLIALRSGAPIIPVYSEKKKHWYERKKAVIGEPFFPKDYCKGRMPSIAETEELSEIFSKSLDKCKKAYYNIFGR